MSPGIFVFVALNCEAKPLIKAWRLKKYSGKRPFAIYADDRRVVVITGIGKAAMAGAIGYALALFSESQQPILLNLGIAGHQVHSLGSLFLADKIVDAETGRRFFPQLPFSVPCSTMTVATQAKPRADYAESCLYDMEASAFYEMAVRFSSNELIHCLKIISDNGHSPLENISEAQVEKWCEEQLAPINLLLSHLASLRQSLPAMDLTLYQQLLGEFHITATNEVKLKALLERWWMQMGRPLEWQDAKPRNVKELMVWLERQLDDAAYYL